MKSRIPGSMSSLPLAALLILVVCSSSVTLAQDSGWYGGAGAGEAQVDMDTSQLARALQGSGYGISSNAVDDKSFAGKLYGGFQFNENFALEGSYFDLSDPHFRATLQPAAMLRGEVKIRGLGLDLVGTVPLNASWSAFARAGINNARLEQNFTHSIAGTGLADQTERGTHEKVGAGLQYAINEAFFVRGEVEYYRLDDNKVTDDSATLWTLGVVYHFGARKPAPPPVAQAVEQPQPAPAPAPPPARVALSANALFDFDKSELKPEGKQALDKLVSDMQGLRYDVVIVTGHTDRIGTRSYNLALSDRRAGTVRTYLVEAGIPAARITARGVNSDEPVTTPQQCQGPVSDALKACLQPDRRVEIDVSGIPE